MFSFRAARGAVEVAFTDRHGQTRGGPGVGSGSFDLAEPSGEGPEADEARARLEDNVRVLARALAAGSGGATELASTGSARAASLPEMVLLRQVHGDGVHVVTRGDLPSGDPSGDPACGGTSGPSGRHGEAAARPVADAAVTDLPGVALVVRVADCVPVLLADVERRVIGAVHAGRPGMVAGVVSRAVEAMRTLGARDLVAWVGPHVCGSCYEVPAEMRAAVSAVVPASYAETSWGTPSVDVGAGVRAQLGTDGVEVVDAHRCTREDDDLWSYRRDGASAGRLAGVVWMRP